ncbi:MAG: HAD family hydrolase [Deferrisomatales bacterium]|nr:HAD family hydrolase [Deferrisomatales bacterium]
MIEIPIPGGEPLRLAALLLDMNGTLSTDGRVAPGVLERLRRLGRQVRVVVATADTFGTARKALAVGGVELRVLHAGSQAAQKERILEELGVETTAAVGNGHNDRRMVARAAIGVAVLGREGAAGETLRRARVVAASPEDALDLFLEPRRLTATLRD